MPTRYKPALALLVLLGALPAQPATAVDVGELESLYARRETFKGGAGPTAPADFAAAVQRLAADGELEKTLGAPKAAGDPRLSPRLKRLVAGLRVKGGPPLAKQLDALAAPAPDGDGVDLALTPESAADEPRLLDLARHQGGTGIVAEASGTVLATVPGHQLEAFLDAARAQASYVDLQTRYEPSFGKTSGEGGELMRVRALHEAGVRGDGVTVAVLDMGFKGYTELVRAGELPAARATQAFGRDPFEASSVHGSACAEIVADVAPAAKQVLARFDGGQKSLQQALNWLRQQPDIAVVNASWGQHLRRIDGLDATDQEIDRFVRDTGAVWVNAAGNEAALTWTGPATDRNGNGAVDVPRDGEVRDFVLVRANGPFAIVVQWDDWGDTAQPVARQDLDIYLLVPQGNGQVALWDRSEEVQNGRQYPMEALSGPGLPGGVGALVIKRKRVDRDVRVRVAVSRGVELLPRDPAFSLSSPASARQALAVGAVDASSRQLASYSSNGPSWDNRLKPEVSAPAGVSSQAYRLEGGGPFHGTSAAAPHVAGFAALLASAGDKPRGAALRAAVEKSIRPMGQPQPNNGYGRGLVVAGPPASGAPASPPPGGVAAKPPADAPSPGGPPGQPPGNAGGRVNRALDDLLRK